MFNPFFYSLSPSLSLTTERFSMCWWFIVSKDLVNVYKCSSWIFDKYNWETRNIIPELRRFRIDFLENGNRHYQFLYNMYLLFLIEIVIFKGFRRYRYVLFDPPNFVVFTQERVKTSGFRLSFHNYPGIREVSNIVERNRKDRRPQHQRTR